MGAKLLQLAAVSDEELPYRLAAYKITLPVKHSLNCLAEGSAELDLSAEASLPTSDAAAEQVTADSRVEVEGFMVAAFDWEPGAYGEDMGSDVETDPGGAVESPLVSSSDLHHAAASCMTTSEAERNDVAADPIVTSECHANAAAMPDAAVRTGTGTASPASLEESAAHPEATRLCSAAVPENLDPSSMASMPGQAANQQE